MPGIDENMQFGFNNWANLLNQYIVIIFMKSIFLFLWRTYTGENHNESGMDRKNLTRGSNVQLMNHESGANF